MKKPTKELKEVGDGIALNSMSHPIGPKIGRRGRMSKAAREALLSISMLSENPLNNFPGDLKESSKKNKLKSKQTENKKIEAIRNKIKDIQEKKLAAQNLLIKLEDDLHEELIEEGKIETKKMSTEDIEKRYALTCEKIKEYCNNNRNIMVLEVDKDNRGVVLCKNITVNVQRDNNNNVFQPYSNTTSENYCIVIFAQIMYGYFHEATDMNFKVVFIQSPDDVERILSKI